MGSIFLFFLVMFSVAQSQTIDSGFISAVISEKGLNFIKSLLIEEELRDLIPLKLPDIEKVGNIPIIGGVVNANLANITLLDVDISNSTIQIGDSGVAIVASGATAALSMDWKYSYSHWPFPFEIVDQGNASVQVEGMEVGLTLTMTAHNGSLKLIVMECGCYIENLSANLDGGASWFYQWFVDAFEDQIRSSVEDAITEKTTEGISKLGCLLQTLPKEIDVDSHVELNITFVNSPLFEDSSIKFDINGLFIPSYEIGVTTDVNKILQPSDSCLGVSRMLEISLDEAVFNSAALVYFQAVDVSGSFEISGNNLAGKVELNDFSLSLKWSEVGNFHMSLILGIIRIFLKTVFIPIVNSHLRHGFPLPIIHGFTLCDTCLVTSSSRIFISSDLMYMNPNT